jgi:hypothetical protein
MLSKKQLLRSKKRKQMRIKFQSRKKKVKIVIKIFNSV